MIPTKLHLVLSARRPRRLRALCLAGVVALLTAAPARARVVEKVAAVVGNSIILASEVEEKAAPLLGDLTRITDPSKRAARATALRRETLERLIDDDGVHLEIPLKPCGIPRGEADGRDTGLRRRIGQRSDFEPLRIVDTVASHAVHRRVIEPQLVPIEIN